MEETEKAYWAGIIDGEGSISCGYQNSGIPQLFVAVGMRDELIPRMLYERFEGSIYEVVNKRSRTGLSWQWQVNGASCEKVLEIIQPYIKLKKMEVTLAIAFVATVRPSSNRKTLTDSELLVKIRIADQLRQITGGDHKGVR